MKGDEVWVLSVRAEGPGPPTEIRVRTFLKALLRRAGLRCLSVGLEDAGELARLRGIVRGLAERVAAQADLLGRRAERSEHQREG